MANLFVYIMSNRCASLYVGMTTNIERRVREHHEGLHDDGSRSYRMSRLLHFEQLGDVDAAIEREKQIKAMPRDEKLRLIAAHNPEFADLSERWYNENLRLTAGDTLIYDFTDPQPRQQA